jgi:hypothetical protein
MHSYLRCKLFSVRLLNLHGVNKYEYKTQLCYIYDASSADVACNLHVLELYCDNNES